MGSSMRLCDRPGRAPAPDPESALCAASDLSRRSRQNRGFGRGVRFAHDSTLEGGVTCELVSVSKFPVSRENTGNFIDSELSGASTRAKKAINSMPYEPIPYASEQGIF